MFSRLFQAKERVIRSQFACTYRDEELPLNRVLEFPSTSQVPTCVHPAPKRHAGNAPAADEERSSDAEETNTGMDLTASSGGNCKCAPEKNVKTQAVLSSLSAGTHFCFL